MIIITKDIKYEKILCFLKIFVIYIYTRVWLKTIEVKYETKNIKHCTHRYYCT